MPKDKIKINQYGDLFDGIIMIQKEPWSLYTSGRGYVTVVKVNDSTKSVITEVPQWVKNMDLKNPDYDKIWGEEMKKIRDLAIAKARQLAKKK